MDRAEEEAHPAEWSKGVARLDPGATAAVVAGSTSGGRAANRSPSSAPRSWFTEITGAVGLRFRQESGAAGRLLMPEVMASGVALLDYDNDGDLDIYLTSGHRALGEKACAGGTPNRLFRQEKDGTFSDVTALSGLGDTCYGMGVAVGDYNNDGLVDVYVTNLAADRLYRNRGEGRFEDVTRAAGIDVAGWSASACFFDYDRDGFLDLFVSQYVKWEPSKKCFSPVGAATYCGPLSFPPVHDVLLRNRGDGTFEDVSTRASVSSVAAAGLGVVCQDLTGDGLPDVYVANDAYPNNLWVNRGKGRFADEALERGVAYNLAGNPEAGMGVLAEDFDNDGDTDLFMTHLDEESNTFYRNLGGDLGFTDVTSSVGLSVSSLSLTGFGAVTFDVELDGDLDLHLVNGRVKQGAVLDGVDVPPPWDVLAQPNLFYLNDGRGHFSLFGEATATLCDPVEVTRGLAMGDLDGDGDVDLVVTNIQGPARVYRNDTPRRGSWLIVRAVDPRLRRDAIGARITVACGSRRFVRTISPAGSYLSSSDVRAHFGLGPATKIDSLEVDWPDGLREEYAGPTVNGVITVVRGKGRRR